MVQSVQSRYRFVEWLDLDGTGVLSECAIVKRFPNGDIYYFTLDSLDAIDKQRLKTILVNRNATLYDELWKVLEQNTLGNGVNALIYFNQLVRQITPSGTILPFGTNRHSAANYNYTPVAAENIPTPEPVATANPPSFEQVAKTTKGKPA
jgi:hypothetical protein